ncbi:SID1 transmembrane family member 1-like isoform X2 [Oscarella lobularis]|uniref:SID1 transmembrane family member 1-like isoform X2 n=1 Tax=Oscarella lobularis TaxID=121494 RepID=UPI003313777A
MAQTSSRISVALLVYYLSIHAELSLSAINELHNATIGEAETGNVSSVTPMTYIFQYDLKDLHDKALRVNVTSSSATTENPILFVVRRQTTVQSWTVPLVLHRTGYASVSRTLCPFRLEDASHGRNVTFYIDLSTSSSVSVDFSFIVYVENTFTLKLGVPETFSVSPSSPKYYQYTFNHSIDFDEILVKVSSEDVSSKNICAIVSVEAGDCPVHDLPSNVRFSSAFQTMLSKAGITIEKKGLFKKGLIYIAFVVYPADLRCQSGVLDNIDNEHSNVIRNASGLSRVKSFTVTVEKALPPSSYASPIAFSVAMCLGFFLMVFIGIFIDWHVRDRKRGKTFLSNLTGATPVNDAGLESNGSNSYQITDGSVARQLDDGDDDGSVNVLSTLHVIENKRKDGDCLNVGDLARLSECQMQSKYKRYTWSLVTIGVFYALPSIQLVIAYQTVLNLSGNQDLCYYNFWCAHPAGILSDFNHVWSNIAYILLGILFFLIVYRRSRRYHRKEELHNTGLPQYFGLSYSMAVALVAEGIMSGTYHICPSGSNFQFDTAFMYLIAVLSTLKLYQSRHAEVQAYAYKSFAAMACLIFVAVIGVLYNNLAFWLCFFFAYVIVILYLNLEIYYIGAWSFGKPLLQQWKKALLCENPFYPHRRRFLIVSTFVNIIIALVGVCTQYADFASYLLAIMLINLSLYLFYYIAMKAISKERLSKLAIFLAVLLVALWTPALYFFTRGLTNWQKSPAESRIGNQDCLMLNFYDAHDIWHFLSAFGVFFGFLAFLTIDDDLEGVDRSTIAVF